VGGKTIFLIIARVMIVPGCGTNSLISSRSRREKGKAMLLVWLKGMIRSQ